MRMIWSAPESRVPPPLSLCLFCCPPSEPRGGTGSLGLAATPGVSRQCITSLGPRQACACDLPILCMCDGKCAREGSLSSLLAHLLDLAVSFFFSVQKRFMKKSKGSLVLTAPRPSLTRRRCLTQKPPSWRCRG